jgi:hypothetical protein
VLKMTEQWENIAAVILTGIVLVAIFGLIIFSIVKTWKASK